MPMDLDEFVDRAVEVIVQFVVRHAIGLPADAAQPAIADLVALRLLAAGVPTGVVDFEGPLDCGVDTVRMNDLSAREGECELANEFDAAVLERSEDA